MSEIKILDIETNTTRYYLPVSVVAEDYANFYHNQDMNNMKWRELYNDMIEYRCPTCGDDLFHNEDDARNFLIPDFEDGDVL